jgi:hypothetical protein
MPLDPVAIPQIAPRGARVVNHFTAKQVEGPIKVERFIAPLSVCQRNIPGAICRRDSIGQQNRLRDITVSACLGVRDKTVGLKVPEPVIQTITKRSVLGDNQKARTAVKEALGYGG